jgi:hypothetical protein
MTLPKSRRTRSWRSGAVFALAATAISFLVAGLMVVPAGAVPGAAAVVVTPGTTAALTSGGSGSEFALYLPGDPRCPGDSRFRPWYYASSFVAPPGVNPGTIKYAPHFPTPGYFARAYGAPWVWQVLEQQTGRVQLPPSFDLQYFTTAMVLPNGARSTTWSIGVACHDYEGVVTNYWKAPITFERSTNDPAGFVWVAHPPKVSSSSGPSVWVIVLGVLAVAVIALLVVRSPWGSKSSEKAGSK